ncbi:unnamed protein product, partial [Medioppia subpectinata]
LCKQNVQYFANGSGFAMAVTGDHRLYSWGDNTWGQLGRCGSVPPPDSNHKCLTPDKITYSDSNRDMTVRQIACGYNYCLALTTSGRVNGWGYNGSGQVGCGGRPSNNQIICRPQKLSFSNAYKITAIYCHYFSSFAVTSDGQVFSWGTNSDHQLGHDCPDVCVPEPRLVSGQNMVKIVTISKTPGWLDSYVMDDPYLIINSKLRALQRQKEKQRQTNLEAQHRHREVETRPPDLQPDQSEHRWAITDRHDVLAFLNSQESPPSDVRARVPAPDQKRNPMRDVYRFIARRMVSNSRCTATPTDPLLADDCIADWPANLDDEHPVENITDEWQPNSIKNAKPDGHSPEQLTYTTLCKIPTYDRSENTISCWWGPVSQCPPDLRALTDQMSDGAVAGDGMARSHTAMYKLLVREWRRAAGTGMCRREYLYHTLDTLLAKGATVIHCTEHRVRCKPRVNIVVFEAYVPTLKRFIAAICGANKTMSVGVQVELLTALEWLIYLQCQYRPAVADVMDSLFRKGVAEAAAFAEWSLADSPRPKDKGLLIGEIKAAGFNLTIIDTKAIVFERQPEDPMDCIEYFICSEIFKELLESVQYLHDSCPSVIHRDLKPANVLISQNNNNNRFLKLCDFGSATFHDMTSMSHTYNVGTSQYMAPEVYQRRYTIKVDIYSLGVIAFHLFDLYNM